MITLISIKTNLVSNFVSEKLLKSRLIINISILCHPGWITTEPAAVHYGISISAKDVRSFCHWNPHKGFCQADSSVKYVLAQPHNNRFESCNRARRWNLVINKDIIQACILFALYRRRRIPGMCASGNAQYEQVQGRRGECQMNGTMLEEWWPDAQNEITQILLIPAPSLCTWAMLSIFDMQQSVHT